MGVTRSYSSRPFLCAVVPTKLVLLGATWNGMGDQLDNLINVGSGVTMFVRVWTVQSSKLYLNTSCWSLLGICRYLKTVHTYRVTV